MRVVVRSRGTSTRNLQPETNPLEIAVKAARNEAMKKQKRLKNRIKHIKHADDALKQLKGHPRWRERGDAQIVKMEEAFAGIEDSPPCEAMEKAGKALPGNLCPGFCLQPRIFGGPRPARPSQKPRTLDETKTTNSVRRKPPSVMRPAPLGPR